MNKKRVIIWDDIEKFLQNTNESSSAIARGAGMYPANISELRRGIRKVENLSLKVAWKLQQYINENKTENN